MSRLTKQHFNWLAKEIAPMLQADKADEFADAVQIFGINSEFKRSKFIDVSATSWILENEVTESQPIDDSIPCLEEPYVIDSEAA